jgi:hypothetical protein
MYRHIPSAPASSLESARRGRPVGRFCKACRSIYPLLAPRHSGKPEYGKDHVAATCSYEGQPFEEGADWWEPAVEVLPEAAPAA